jgi:uncharacterized membrane protein YphA (DoxX/SURF4 family)
MNTALWVIQILLAVVFAGAGTLKLTLSLPDLEKKVGGWVHEVPLPVIRTVGALEIAAALGLTLPAAVDVAPFLTWLAAAGLIVTMLGGARVHLRRHETHEVGVNVLLALLAAAIVWGRVGPYSF